MFYSQNDHTLSSFHQTVRDTDAEFYATFPQARDALAAISSVNDVDLSLHSYHYPANHTPPPNSAFSQSSPSYHIHRDPQASSDYAFSYQQQHSDLTSPPVITQSSFDPVSFALHPSSDLADPSVCNVGDFPGRVASAGSCDTPIAPIFQSRKRRAPRSPTAELTNGCELGVMQLDHFPEPTTTTTTFSNNNNTQTSYCHTDQRRTQSVSYLSSRALTWDIALNSPRSPIRLSPLPRKRQLEKKPSLACLFCRGRKIACGPPLPGSLNKTCNQCQRRSLRCEYPSESRRGMRKKKSSSVVEAPTALDV